MQIEFDCPACLSKLRVPASSQGQKARCPSCQTIVQIPGQQEVSSGSVPPSPGAVDPGQTNIPLGKAEPKPNVFSQPASDSGAPNQAWNQPNPANPYAPSQTPAMGMAYQNVDVSPKLMAAGIVMLMVNLFAIGFGSLTLMGFIGQVVENNAREEDYFVFICVMLTLLGQVISLIGAACMVAKKHRGFCLAAVIIGMISGLPCCLAPTLVGIFPLVVLLDYRVKLLMDSNR